MTTVKLESCHQEEIKKMIWQALKTTFTTTYNQIEELTGMSFKTLPGAKGRRTTTAWVRKNSQRKGSTARMLGHRRQS